MAEKRFTVSMVRLGRALKPAHVPARARPPAPNTATTAGRLRQLALIGLGAAGVPLDTAVNIAFPAITASFQLPIAMIQWVVVSYVLTYGSLMLAFGRIGDIFGHARVFRAGLAWSASAFILCAAAPAYGWLLFFRFLQGIGAGLVISVTPALVTSLYPEHRRSRSVAAFTMMFAVASAAGPLIGGILVRDWGWPAVFWFRAPIAGAALLLLRGLPRPAAPATREPLDIPGAALLVVGTAALLLAANALHGLGRREYIAIVPATIAVAALYGFGRWERRVSRPIVDLGLFQVDGFAAINLASVLVSLTSFAVLLLTPYYLVRFSSFSPPSAGAMIATSFAGTIAAAPLAGRLVGRIAAERVALLGALLGAAALALIGFWHPGMAWPLPSIVATLALQGFGVGLFQVVYLDVVIRTLPPTQRGVAGGLAMLTRTLGIVGGATLLTLLFHAFAADGFLAAYSATFRLASLGLLMAGIIALKGRGR